MPPETIDISAALLAHLRWAMVLEDLIDGGRPYMPLEGHESCVLGVWLYGEGVRRHGNNKTLWVLKVAHKQFHRLSDEILARTSSGATDDLNGYLEKLRRVSREVLFQLASLELDTAEATDKSRLNRFLSTLWMRALGEDREVDSPLSVQSARFAHLRWCREVQEALSGRKHNVSVQSYDACALGRWLQQRVADAPEGTPHLDVLDNIHKRFHGSVEQALAALKLGDYRSADDAYGDVYDCSAEVILQLTRLELALEEATACHRAAT